MLLNGDVLNLSVKIIKGHVRIGSDPNAKYTDKTIIYCRINARNSQTSVNQVSNNCVDVTSAGNVYTGFVILTWSKFRRILIIS